MSQHKNFENLMYVSYHDTNFYVTICHTYFTYVYCAGLVLRMLVWNLVLVSHGAGFPFEFRFGSTGLDLAL